ncbi:hypothetical protein P7K49_021890 [Saguinus oedipus]|uniref:Uncharacterized protein n=1 Tax=Saguinus oedipus TaxID=9490 RepID=A0ABQ9UU26_SAGOE|nr:hypothetical protein P7K49_021890 [Saguinus oedipus]
MAEGGPALSWLWLKQEMGGIVTKLIRDYNSSREDSLQDAWDYVQAQYPTVESHWLVLDDSDAVMLLGRWQVRHPRLDCHHCHCRQPFAEPASSSIRWSYCPGRVRCIVKACST